VSARKRTLQKRDCKQIFGALSEYLDGELDPEFCATLEKHMKGCEPCEAFLATLKKTVDLCRESSVPLPKPLPVSPQVRQKMQVAYAEFEARMKDLKQGR